MFLSVTSDLGAEPQIWGILQTTLPIAKLWKLRIGLILNPVVLFAIKYEKYGKGEGSEFNF